MRRETRVTIPVTKPLSGGRRELLVTFGGAVLGAACGDGETADGVLGGAGPMGGGGPVGGGALGGGGSGAGSVAGTGGAGGGPTPACEETADDIEGPFYTPGAPLLVPGRDGRVVLSPEEPGERIVLEGRVLGAGCEPLAGAEIDLWQADVDGAYDLEGFVLRGRVKTSSEGRFAIMTVLPGRYLNGATYRPRHLHVKVRADEHAELTTQLYFPGDPFNESDAFFDERLLVSEEIVSGESFARFDFVLPLV